MNNYIKIEVLFTELQSILIDVFSKNEVIEFQDFVNNGEYGLAFETVVDIFAEEQKNTTQPILMVLKELAIEMDLGSSYLNRLSN